MTKKEVSKYDTLRRLKTVALVLALLLTMSATTFARDGSGFWLDDEPLATGNEGSMVHSADYEMEGRIELKKQAGHEYETGARMRQVIGGEGSMAKGSDIYMESGYLQVADSQDWVTDDQTLRKLGVTTSIKLFTPPKYVYGDEQSTVWWKEVYEAFSERQAADHWDALTDQVWAVNVEADPGQAGQLTAGFEAAFDFGVVGGRTSRNIGDYFNIEQQAAVTGGTLRRYIDISSPRRHAYLHEDMRVTGSSSVSEAFSLENIRGRGLSWYELF